MAKANSTSSATSVTVGLVSDTHGWLDPALLSVFAGVEHIIHAGDIGSEEVLRSLEKIAPVTAVKGNIDGGDLRFLPLEAVLPVGERSVGVLHIAGSPRRPKRQAVEFIVREGLDVLIVGHSHIPMVARIAEALWINPGAAGRHGFHQERTAALLHVNLETSAITMDRVVLGSRSRSADAAGA
jgi:uncharacterized protein